MGSRERVSDAKICSTVQMNPGAGFKQLRRISCVENEDPFRPIHPSFHPSKTLKLARIRRDGLRIESTIPPAKWH